MSRNALGRVLGSREVGVLEFWVGVEPGQYLRLDDLVVVEFPHPDPAQGTLRYYGMVDQVVKLHEGSQFDTDIFLVSQELLPASLAYAARVRVTRLEPEEYLPPDPGSLVYRAEGEDLERALYYDRMRDARRGVDLRLPAGLLRTGGVAYLNLEFLNGVKGGHANISGISGVAAKTSYATFLLYSLFYSGILPEAEHSRAVIFNVKGEDLFFLDRPNNRLDPQQAALYGRMGLPVHPFTSVAFWAPPQPTSGLPVPDVGSRRLGVQTYFWDLAQFCRQRLLPYLFADRGAMSNLGFLIDTVTERLYHLAKDQQGPYLLVEGSGDEALSFEELGKVRLSRLSELVDFLEEKLLDEESPWAGRQARGTREAFIRRLKAAAEKVHHLIRGDRPGNPPDPLGTSAQLSLIDIHRLAGPAQMFVVGALLQEIFRRKEGGSYRGRVFIVLDELNKYAPREEESPIKDILLDIAERGRSLGVILLGAEQTASEVERRVVANAAIRVLGRLDAAEAERPEYRYLPASFRERAVILPQGSMILHQPELPVPLLISFPFPAWATKAEEAEEEISGERLRDELGL